MPFEAKNVLNKHFVFKFVEFVRKQTIDNRLRLFLLQVFVFIVFMIFRVGDHGNIFFWGRGPQPSTNTPTTTITTPTSTSTSTTTTITTTSGSLFLEKLLLSRNIEDRESFKSSDCSLSERDENDVVFGVMTTVGYWFITMVLMVGLILGDRPKITVNVN